jgi:hypothetical protein
MQSEWLECRAQGAFNTIFFHPPSSFQANFRSQLLRQFPATNSRRVCTMASRIADDRFLATAAVGHRQAAR